MALPKRLSRENDFRSWFFDQSLSSVPEIHVMEEGTKAKKTVFVGGIGDDVDESVIYENFATFGWCFRSQSDSH